MNQLKVNQQQTIVALFEQGWSKRRIARELGVDRLTVRRYLAAADPKSPTDPRTGSDAPSSNSPTPHPGCGAELDSKSPVNPRNDTKKRESIKRKSPGKMFVHNRWVSGARITETVLPDGKRRFTATIRGLPKLEARRASAGRRNCFEDSKASPRDS